jgi:hypothetical protein
MPDPLWDYEDTIARMRDWTYQAEAFDREIAQEAAEAEDVGRRDAHAMSARRREFALELAAEVESMAASRHGGPPNTHDLALARAAVEYRWGLPRDHDAYDAAFAQDPEPLGRELETASLTGAQQGRGRPPVDDDEFDALVAALEAESKRVLELARVHASAGLLRPLFSASDIRSLRSIRAGLDALLPSRAW